MQKRLLSLDVFRGAAIAVMIFVNNANDLQHVAWNGWNLIDTISPFFLWIVGVSMTFSLGSKLAKGGDKKTLFAQILKRSLILFALGLFLNAFPMFNLSIVRIPGVLQRIAVCYFFAGAIFLETKITGQVIWTIFLLVFYWLFVKLTPVPGFGPGILEPNRNIIQYIDNLFLKGHMLIDNWDPEGIVSTISAIATVLFGTLTGHLLTNKEDPIKKTIKMLIGGGILVFTGSVMNIFLPINKNLWTSSYTVFMAGLALFIFGIFYFTIDVKKYDKWSFPFVIYGTNAITIYVLSGLLTKILGENSKIFALAHVFLFLGLAYFMYKKRLFIKI